MIILLAKKKVSSYLYMLASIEPTSHTNQLDSHTTRVGGPCSSCAILVEISLCSTPSLVSALLDRQQN